MDPNANLEELLRLVAIFQEAQDDAMDEDEDAMVLSDNHPVIDAADVYRMAELVEALDNWIRRGGFLPTAWRRDNPWAVVAPKGQTSRDAPLGTNPCVMIEDRIDLGANLMLVIANDKEWEAPGLVDDREGLKDNLGLTAKGMRL